MPPVSEAQRRAMWAAANGRSTLGIPKAVGEEFVAKDAMNGLAAGIMFVAPDGDILLLRRRSNDENWAGHWDLPGGKGEQGESPEEVAAREAGEEVGSIPHLVDRKLLDSAVTPRGKGFHTFVQAAETKFAPQLSDEHSGFAWAPLDMLPQPLHPGIRQTLDRRLELDLAGAMTLQDWAELKQNFADWARTFTDEPMPAMDGIAFDRSTVRSVDADGHLKVELTPISKANVCPYYGREIAGAEEMGLDPEKVYRLYRDPGELAKAATSFAGKQLLLEHVPVSADDPHLERTVGSVGDGVEFRAPYLMAPLSIWDGEAIALIESGDQKELSSAYRYRADMTPGTSPEGEPYDGIMRDISGNHVALVAKGRAGPDVVVQDELPSDLDPEAGRAGPELHGGAQEITMSKINRSLMGAVAHGALIAYLKPRLAQDAKIDLAPVLEGVNGKTFKAKKGEIAAAVKTATAGKLAKDANIDTVVDVLDAIENMAGDDMEANAGMPEAGKVRGKDEDPDKRRDFLKEKLSEDDMAAYDAICQEAMDEEKDDKDEKDDKVDKKAMDAAIADAVKTATDNANRNQREIREAEELVRPYIGKLAVAHDSAPAVLRTALGVLGVKDVDKLHPDALKPILLALPVPGATKPVTVAMDAAGVSSFHEMYPEAKANPVRAI